MVSGKFKTRVMSKSKNSTGTLLNINMFNSNKTMYLVAFNTFTAKNKRGSCISVFSIEPHSFFMSFRL